MEKLTYTRRERDEELALFRLTQWEQLVATDGVDAANAFTKIPNSESIFPDEVEVEHLPIYESLNRLENYGVNATWHEQASSDCDALGRLIESVAHPERVKRWRTEDEENQKNICPEEESARWDVLGAFYHGILEYIHKLAAARSALDRGNPLTLSQVAALAEMNDRSVMNAANAKGSGRLKADGKDWLGRRTVEAPDALAWLSARPAFKPTTGKPEEIGVSKHIPTHDSSPVTFLPESRDGSRFLPEKGLQGTYRIGKKGEEFTVEGYFNALLELMKMETPRWRRKNESGNEGIVTGTHWVKARPEEFDIRSLDNDCSNAFIG